MVGWVDLQSMAAEPQLYIMQCILLKNSEMDISPLAEAQGADHECFISNKSFIMVPVKTSVNHRLEIKAFIRREFTRIYYSLKSFLKYHCCLHLY